MARRSTREGSINGVKESVFVEAILLTRKFTYCRKVAWQSNIQGFPTWSIIAAYDASFYAAKAICCFLGVVSLGRHSKWYLNVLEYNRVKTAKKSWQSYPVLKAYHLSEFMTHKMLWGITSRLLRTLSFGDDQAAPISLIKSIDLSGVSETRNGILYNGGHWPFSDDVNECDLHKQLSNLLMLRALGEGSVLNENTDRYFNLCMSLEKVLYFFLDEISQLAPAYVRERTAISDWRIPIV